MAAKSARVNASDIDVASLEEAGGVEVWQRDVTDPDAEANATAGTGRTGVPRDREGFD